MKPVDINALPDHVREYIHALETICDPSGLVQTIASLTEQRDALAEQNRELRDRISILHVDLDLMKERNANQASMIHDLRMQYEPRLYAAPGNQLGKDALKRNYFQEILALHDKILVNQMIFGESFVKAAWADDVLKAQPGIVFLDEKPYCLPAGSSIGQQQVQQAIAAMQSGGRVPIVGRAPKLEAGDYLTLDGRSATLSFFVDADAQFWRGALQDHDGNWHPGRWSVNGICLNSSFRGDDIDPASRRRAALAAEPVAAARCTHHVAVDNGMRTSWCKTDGCAVRFDLVDGNWRQR
jgi:hypothetical protein